MEIPWGFRKYPIQKIESSKRLGLFGDWMQLLIHDLARIFIKAFHLLLFHGNFIFPECILILA